MNDDRIVLGQSVTRHGGSVAKGENTTNVKISSNSHKSRHSTHNSGIDFDEKIVKLGALNKIPDTYIGADDLEHQISAHSIKKVLKVLGVPTDTDQQIEQSIIDHNNKPWLTPIKPTIIEIEGYGSEVDLYLPQKWFNSIDDLDLQIILEQGIPRDLIQSSLREDIVQNLDEKLTSATEKVQIKNISEAIEERVIDDVKYEHRIFKLSSRLPIGYHTIILALPTDDNENNTPQTFKSHLIITPQKALVPDQQYYGFTTQFYSNRSLTSWGIGDFENVRCLAVNLKPRTGADFLLINPVHADHTTLPQTPSPYMPMSKRWLNPIYIRPEMIPEHIFSDNYSGEKSLKMVEKLGRMARPLNKQSSIINRDTVWALKKSALYSIYQLGISETEQIIKFEKFKRDGDISLTKFATWCSMVDDYGFNGAFQRLDSDAEEVIEYQKNNADNIEFYRWVQWIADRQLCEIQQEFKDSGAKIGLICDLAVGVNKYSADVWIEPSAYIKGASVGGPPDMYNQKGQNWALPPLNSDYLEQTGYRLFHECVRAIMQRCGAIRIDHILGLFRFWYIPDDTSAQFGAYVEYNHDALIGILALESVRNNCYIIGEDMGVIPPGAFDYLKKRGILGTSVLWFEREKDGSVTDVSKLRELCFTSVTTHDIPPTLGYIDAEHIRLRSELGLLTTDESKLRNEHSIDLQNVRRNLINNELLNPHEQYDNTELSIALQKSLFKSPSLLIGFALADFVGEYRAENQPGTNNEYPNWRIPLEDASGNLVFNDKIFDNPYFAQFCESIPQINKIYNKGEENAS